MKFSRSTLFVFNLLHLLRSAVKVGLIGVPVKRVLKRVHRRLDTEVWSCFRSIRVYLCTPQGGIEKNLSAAQ
jgi:hypothetical protein